MIYGKLVSPMLADYSAAYATVVREPYEGKPPVRFDEGAGELEAWRTDIAPQTGKP